tara:strand:+ start:1616 stop:2353 length:738 start_codon:yes stop_codon:yes gene_type:complete
MKFNVDTNAVVIHTNKLEKLSKSAFPNAVRGTLNSLAFDVKKNTMPKSALRFKKRQKNFFKSNSRVNMAKGPNLRSMKSEIGFINKAKTAESAVEELEQQEHGGKIDEREYIPVKAARTSKNNKRMVQKRNRLGTIGIKNIVKASKMSARNQGGRFVQAVAMAGVGGFVQSKLKGKNTTMVWRVNSLSRTKGGRFKLTPVYIVNESKSVKVKATHFMEKATKKTMQSADKFYIKQAEREFEKALR